MTSVAVEFSSSSTTSTGTTGTETTDMSNRRQVSRTVSALRNEAVVKVLPTHTRFSDKDQRKPSSVVIRASQGSGLLAKARAVKSGEGQQCHSDPYQYMIALDGDNKHSIRALKRICPYVTEKGHLFIITAVREIEGVPPDRNEVNLSATSETSSVVKSANAVEKAQDAFAKVCADNNVTYTTLTTFGPSRKRDVCTAAAEFDIEMLVIARHPHKLTIGGFTKYVLENSPCHSYIVAPAEQRISV